jgi:NADPH-dependent 2,4-dienoyl-CoA reductase/sulfur reductase-like enzyme
MSLKRRTILQMIPATAALAMMPKVRAGLPHHVVVVGGGFAGATVAKYIRMWSNGAVDVTLVEPRAKHVSCVMSNLVLNGSLKTRDLAFDYNALQSKYGVRVVQDKAVRINGAGKEVRLKGSGWMPYDSLVLAMGIKFDKVPGLDSRKLPHAWIAGGQTNLLRRQIRDDIPLNGTFVMTIPEAPYRCPPGPYERACLVADILKRRGGSPKVIVLDANTDIQAEKGTFNRAFNGIYGDIIDYRPGVKLTGVDSDGRYAYTSREVTGGIQEDTVRGDVINVIPRHGAPQLLVKSGLTADSRWAPVDPVSYGSSLAEFPGVYVIGDSQGTGKPKSGHMANAQAKVCADAIIRRATDLPVDTDERLNNITTNSACFSPITATEASWLTAVFRYNRDTGTMQLVPGSLGEAHRWNTENYKDMFTWSRNLFADTFA